MKHWSTPRRTVLAAALLVLPLAACGGNAGEGARPTTIAAADGPVADTLVVYKTATCGCCKDWMDHMEEHGFTVVGHDYELTRLNSLKRDAGVAPDLSSCHTALIGGYVVEGHVPADLVRRMLAERPAIAGIAVPGMPVGSPGMEGPFKQAYQVMAFRADGSREVYAER